ncbi:hypothetical protein Tsubulata_046727 [Turnera subulata]|uniref:Uncharacterized protein n=1 Tax=Turnera subulata TaxID=218843 RepID=A0A9Q0GF41_9ROSI|nr:hypothetical protein Tsubulata_046727 [Turnera subulata]
MPGDMDPHASTNQTESSNSTWTNEKHVKYLNSMEASFVLTMLENRRRPPLRLDRLLPDSSESTLDLKSPQYRRNNHTALEITGRRRRSGLVDDKRTRRLSSPGQCYDPSQDQVVPQLENRTGDKDERDPPTAAVAPSAPTN